MELKEFHLLACEIERESGEQPQAFLDRMAFRCYLKKGYVPQRLIELQQLAAKYNHNHDELGRFATGDGGDNDRAVDQIGGFLQSVFGIGSAQAAEADDEEENRPRAEEIGPGAAARQEAYEALSSQLRAIDPNNRYLTSISGPNWVPDYKDVEELGQELSDVRNRQLAEQLAPGGNPVGAPGTQTTIRELPGGQNAAEELLNDLSRGMTPLQHPVYGACYRLPDGGFLGYRIGSDGTPTIDINIKPLDQIIDKLKFPSQ